MSLVTNRKISRFLYILFLAGLLSVLFYQFLGLFSDFLKTSQYVTKVGFNRQRVIDLHVSSVGREAQKYLPDDAPVQLTEGLNINRIGIRYRVFPHKVVDQAPFVIDGHANISNSFFEKRNLGGGFYLYAAPGYHFVNKRLTTEPPYSVQIFRSMFFTVFLCIFGMLVLRKTGFVGISWCSLWFLSFGYLLGFFIVTVSVWIYLLIGGALSISSVFLSC